MKKKLFLPYKYCQVFGGTSSKRYIKNRNQYKNKHHHNVVTTSLVSRSIVTHILHSQTVIHVCSDKRRCAPAPSHPTNSFRNRIINFFHFLCVSLDDEINQLRYYQLSACPADSVRSLTSIFSKNANDITLVRS